MKYFAVVLVVMLMLMSVALIQEVAAFYCGKFQFVNLTCASRCGLCDTVALVAASHIYER